MWSEKVIFGTVCIFSNHFFSFSTLLLPYAIIELIYCVDVIQHDILIKKLRIIGFQPQAIEIIKSFLENRRQYVQVHSKDSETLIVGANSVIQGSTLSVYMYTLFILDLPYLFHNEIHELKEHQSCKKLNIKLLLMILQ